MFVFLLGKILSHVSEAIDFITSTERKAYGRRHPKTRRPRCGTRTEARYAFDSLDREETGSTEDEARRAGSDLGELREFLLRNGQALLRI